jgi:capsular polysaccharide biosynthesis protein
VRAALATYATHQYREWIYDLREPCYVEPSGGFVFGSRGEWLTDPFLYHQLIRHPPYRNLLKAIRQRRTGHRFECALSLRCATEENYWHFYDDVLSKLRLADELSVPEDVPILVGDGLWRQAFFQEAIRRGALRGRNWFRHDTVVQVERLILAVPMSFQRANLEYALRALDAPKPVPSERRLFLSRSKRRSRSLLNVDDLLPWLADCGFEAVDTDGLTLAAQMKLFGSARVVVGNHGAGLANLVYRVGQPLELVEVFSPNFIRPHFVAMAQMFGFGYDAVVGDAEGSEGDFLIDPEGFKTAVSRAIGRAG